MPQKVTRTPRHIIQLSSIENVLRNIWLTLESLQFGVRPNRDHHCLVHHVYKKYIPKLMSYNIESLQFGVRPNRLHHSLVRQLNNLQSSTSSKYAMICMLCLSVLNSGWVLKTDPSHISHKISSWEPWNFSISCNTSGIRNTFFKVSSTGMYWNVSVFNTLCRLLPENFDAYWAGPTFTSTGFYRM